jgi:CheY-like chemotaxis protein
MNNNKSSNGRYTKGRGETVLAVDDDEALLPAIVELLTMIGYRLITAKDGRVAIEKYQLNHPDVVLMDRHMPRMDGVEAAQRILDFDPEAKVVLLSGRDACGRDGIEPSLLKRIKAYLNKPVEIKELSQVLSYVING